MTFKQAEKLHIGDEVIDKNTGESIHVICAFEEPLPKRKKCIMIEGTGAKQGYNHWIHTKVK
jgi:hypothetical protein